MSVGHVTQTVLDFGLKRVLITGGEPLLQPGSLELMKTLCDAGRIVLVETNGSKDLSLLPKGVIAIMDIKCPGSGQAHMMDWKNLGRLRMNDQVKFVLRNRQDYEWARDVYRKHLISVRNEVLLSTVYGSLEPHDLAQWLLSDNLEVRLQLQLHKLIWPNESRGV